MAVNTGVDSALAAAQKGKKGRQPVPTAAEELTGPQKAAILIIQLGTQRASRVLQQMKEDEVTRIVSEVATMPSVNIDTVREIWTEFRDLATASFAVARGGMDYARQLLEESLGPTQASRILDQLSAAYADTPFEFLARADARQVVSFLSDEHPQTISLVLAHLPPDRAAMIMSGFDEGMQQKVSARIATMEATTPQTIERVESVIARRFATALPMMEQTVAGGVQALVDILNRSDRSTERMVLEGLEATNAEMAEEVRSRMFVFEDIVALDDRGIQTVLRTVKVPQLAVALKGVGETVKEKITRNLSERATETLIEEMEDMGPVRVKDVEEAQAEIVRLIRKLEDAGDIVIMRGGGGADEFIQ